MTGVFIRRESLDTDLYRCEDIGNEANRCPGNQSPPVQTTSLFLQYSFETYTVYTLPLGLLNTVFVMGSSVPLVI